MKICGRCNEVLDDSEFYTLKNGKLHTYCKKCLNKINSDRYKRRHKESVEETIWSEQEKADLRELWLKRCGCCGAVLPLDMFNRDKNRKDGLEPICKHCKSEKSKRKHTARKEYNELIESGFKVCASCKEVLPLNQFLIKNGRPQPRCSICRRKDFEEYFKKLCDMQNDITRKEAKAMYEVEYKEELKKEKERRSEESKKRQAESHKEYTKKRYNTEPMYRLKCSVRNCICGSFKRTGQVKKEKTEKIVGLPLEEFINYLKNTFFLRYGYEWDGEEPVHIDHIIPLSTASTEESVVKLCHYSNLQLLKAHDNLVKNNRLDWDK